MERNIHYYQIAKAIDYITEHFREQPSLEEIASALHISPTHFQKIFTEWAGVSPKQFLQYISIDYAKDLLKEKQATLFDTSYAIGMSSTSRLHDLFVKIEGMTPAEYKNGGSQLIINYSFSNTSFGNIIVASTPKGVCHIAFEENPKDAVSQLKDRFPNADVVAAISEHQTNALTFFEKGETKIPKINLHLKGTPFQIKVWEALLKIPTGNLTTYNTIANHIGNPNASRAVGSAIGSNPIAFLIPCHRVIQSTGKFGGYMWGHTRKIAMIGWEATLNNTQL